MRDSSNNKKETAYLSDSINPVHSDMDELRALLLGSEYDELLTLKAQLEDKHSYANNIADIVAEAIAIRAKRDQSLSRSLVSSVDDAIQISVRKDPKPVVAALSPIIGPMIRKSIAEAFSAMLESLDKTLSNSMSVRSIKWRFDARRTGRSYSEVVLLNTLAYQVEQVFLIHRKSGLLLQHVQSDNAITKDPDLVSGMFSAIQDFIKDSFDVEKSEDLEMMKLGELTVLLAHSSDTSLAAVVRGTPHSDLKLTLQETSEEIHTAKAESLIQYNGDTEDFVDTIPMLESCLLSQTQNNEARKPWPAIILLTLVVFAIIGFSVLQYLEREDWSAAITRLNNEPGIVITETGKRDGNYFVRGLKDEYTRTVDDVIGEEFLQDHTVDRYFTAYISSENELVLQRAKTILDVPESVNVRLDDGELVMSGDAPSAWIQWLTSKHWAGLAGIKNINTSALIDIDGNRKRLQTLTAEIEQFMIFFRKGAVKLDVTQLRTIDLLVSKLQQLAVSAALLKTDYKIRVLGHSDSSGTEQRNLEVSYARAQKLANLLIKRGIKAELLKVEGVGDRLPVSDLKHQVANITARRVTLDIAYNH